MNYKQSVALNSWKYSWFSLDLLLTHIWSFTLKPLIENFLWLLELKKQQQTLGFLSLNSSVSAFRTKILITPLKATLAHYKLEQQSLLYCLCTSLICFDISETPPCLSGAISHSVWSLTSGPHSWIQFHPEPWRKNMLRFALWFSILVQLWG